MTHVSVKHLESYRRDGVVLLRNAFERHWIDELRRGLDKHVAKPGAMSRYYSEADEADWFFYDTLNWSRIAEYKRFAFGSSAAEIAGELMEAREVRILNDEIFYRGTGTQQATPFHQDLPYLCIDTDQLIGLWIPLVPVEKQSALAFVPGSHRSGKHYERPPFSATEANLSDPDGEFEPLPDIASDPERFGVVSWDMEPGDCVLFHGLTIHGGSGKLRADRDLKAFAIHWIGERTRCASHPGGTDPDFRSICAANGISLGDPMACDAFPLVWSRDRESAQA